MTAAIGFHCSACGKCCNSAPQASLPELLYHQHRFIGCLTVRRLRVPELGERRGRCKVVTGADQAAYSELFQRVAHPLPRACGWVQLVTQAYDEAGSACPCLAEDGRCAIHADRKPAVCSVVPLDAWLPDRAQASVLHKRRHEAEFMGAECIVLGSSPGSKALPLVHNDSIVDDAAAAALVRRRADLEREKLIWGNAVFRFLTPELFTNAASFRSVPASGYLSLSIAPVLLAVAGASEACRQRCLEYVEAQAALIQARSAALNARATAGSAAHQLPATHQLQAFARSHLALRHTLSTRRVTFGADPNHRAQVEAWLGVHS